MPVTTRTDWRRALPFLVASWLYVPIMFLIMALARDRAISENMMGLLLGIMGLLVLAPFVPYIKGWLSSRALGLLYVLPYSLLLLVLVMFMSD